MTLGGQADGLVSLALGNRPVPEGFRRGLLKWTLMVLGGQRRRDLNRMAARLDRKIGCT